jgi:hypothetical protein
VGPFSGYWELNEQHQDQKGEPTFDEVKETRFSAASQQ